MTQTLLFYRQLKEALEQASVVIVATIVKTKGSTPREVGAKMAVCPDGRLIGTIGGGAGEAKVIEQALSLSNPEKRLVEIDLTGAPRSDIQGVCGGKVQVWIESWGGKGAIALVKNIIELLAAGKSDKLVTPFGCDRHPYLASESEQVCLGIERSSAEGSSAERSGAEGSSAESSSTDCFIEILQPQPILLIVGGGHIAVSLAHIASFAGFQIAVQDDRSEFVDIQRFPQALHLSQSMSAILDRLAAYAHPTSSQLYVALVARGYQQDVSALQAILQRPLAYKYVGAIGSQKRIVMIRQALQQQGISVERLHNFYAPIGLDIGALTPEEIAISICGEIIKVRRGGTGLSLCERIQQAETSAKVHAKIQTGERLHANRR